MWRAHGHAGLPSSAITWISGERQDGPNELERWLLDTGKPHLKTELLEIAERETKDRPLTE
jgi:hypothetical protein